MTLAAPAALFSFYTPCSSAFCSAFCCLLLTCRSSGSAARAPRTHSRRFLRAAAGAVSFPTYLHAGLFLLPAVPFLAAFTCCGSLTTPPSGSSILPAAACCRPARRLDSRHTRTYTRLLHAIYHTASAADWDCSLPAFCRACHHASALRSFLPCAYGSACTFRTPPPSC